MITVHVKDQEQIVFQLDSGGKAPTGWWNDYPRLALYIAAGIDESGGTPMVPEALIASNAEAQLAEDQLTMFPVTTVSDMGYYDLVPCANPEDGTEFLAHEIASRYY